VSFAAPLPVGMAAERELIDVVLTERWPVWRVRDALDRLIPSGWRLVDVFDVWLAGPPLAGRVAAADYRIELGGQPDAGELARAAAELMSAPRIPRERRKGDGTVSYDLRRLLTTVSVDAVRPPVVRTRTRFDPELGTGRPEEVIGALGDQLGVSLEVRAIVRERLLLDEDLAEAEDGTRR
jgi:radical SAM-linked protein